MRRLGVGLLLALFMLGIAACAQAEESAFVVVDEEESVAPDPRRQASALMRDMTLREKIYQLFIVSPEALTGEARTDTISDFGVFARYPVGGVVLYGQNIVSETQLQALTAAIRMGAKENGVYAPFIAVDEEGGNVSRVANKLGYALAPSPGALGESGDENAARAAGIQIAGYLAPLGINLDFAPVADALVVDAPEIGDRAYGSDPEMVSRLSAAMASGLRAGGVIPCYKHFPGHGAVSGNTHNGAASTRRTLEEMRLAELIPFQAGIDASVEMIMVSHFTARGLDDSAPVSLSAAVITGLLRGEMGYDGVVITDALRMSAITAEMKPGVAAVRALQAGADLLLLPSDLDAAADAVLRAVETGEIPSDRIDASVRRILALKITSGLIQ